jgi:hypothetical protein
MWGFSARDETLSLPAKLTVLDGAESVDAVMALMGDWHPTLQRLAQTADVSTVTAFAVKTQVELPRRQLTNDSEIVNFLLSYAGKFDMYVEDECAAYVRYCLPVLLLCWS